MTGVNPLLELHRAHRGAVEFRDQAIRNYSFAIPDEEALVAIGAWAPSGVVEIGAGTGYWANQLASLSIDVVAYDIEPAPSPANRWFAGSPRWYAVQPGDERVAQRHPDRCLLLVWPTINEAWAARALALFHQAGGQTVAYVGEGAGGRSGDDLLHRLIGELDVCLQCRYDLPDVACTCDAVPLFAAVEQVQIPTWAGFDDRLLILSRI